MTRYRKCLVDDCDGNGIKPGSGRGWCSKHYQRFKKHNDPLGGGAFHVTGGANCTIDGCSNKSAGKGLCPMHRARKAKHGDPLIEVPRNRSRIGWIEDNSSYQGDDCLKWPFNVSAHGRGTAFLNGRNMSAPRIMCILAHGEPANKRLQAAHSCGNGHLGCMNPRHLSWKTARENERDKLAHGTIRVGSAVNTSKLKKDDVYDIRENLDIIGATVLAKKYGVSTTTIYKIYDRKSWAWLPEK